MKYLKTIMKNIFYFFLPILLLAVGCDESSDNDIVIKGGDKLTINASQTQASFTFTVPDTWSLHTDATDWLTPDILEGAAGTYTVNLTVAANTSETSRTATIDIRCANDEEKLLITQLGTADTPLPPSFDGKYIKSLMIKDTSDGETISSTFEYNEKGQLVKIIGKDVYEDETDVYEYIIAYTDGNVEIKGRDGEEYTAAIDARGRATQVRYVDTDDDNQTIDITLAYDNEGQLTKETGKTDDYNNYTIEYKWTNGNLTQTTYGGYSDTDFRYSEYENTGNLDINWIISGGYSESGVSPLGLLGLLGKRSAHYVVPNYWDMASSPTPGWDIERPVREDLIGTTQTDTYTVTESDENKVTAQYSFDADNDLSGIVTETPVYRISYERTATIVRTNPNEEPFVGEDGTKYYWEVEVQFSDPVESSREQIGTDRTEISIGY